MREKINVLREQFSTSMVRRLIQPHFFTKDTSVKSYILTFIVILSSPTFIFAADLAVVYHSRYGHTEVIAKAVAKGAAEVPETKVDLIRVQEDGTITSKEWKRLESIDGIIFGAPTYMGSLSGPFKVFMDSTSKLFSKRIWQDKITGGFTNSGALSGDKLSSLLQLVVFTSQHGMVWVGSTSLPEQKATPESINRLGSYVGTMAQSSQASPKDTPPTGDLKTAELYGHRIATALKRWKKD